jgi:hypothetical protein
MSNRNYYKIMAAVLEGIVTAQKNGGFKAFVQMGDVVHFMTVIPVITFVKGNAKSGDTLVSRFGGKNCIARVPGCVCVARRILTTHCTDAYGSEWHTNEH